ncbi:MAG: redox-regulated ATPase YchF [Anaerolineae bacterium]|jgi:GTP-binding protein YchF|nr:redox-regulated ATPase YchF [Anaerolineae bacterium]
MQLGIIGLPQSGKTTLFNALTRGKVPTGMSSGRIEVHTGVVDVPDSRVDQLSAMFHPKKTIYAKVTYADIAGLDGSSSTDKGISGELLNHLQKMDGFILVIRAFENPMVMHPRETIDPLRDLATMESEFILNDLVAVDRKLTRLADEDRKGGAGRDRALVKREIVLFEKLNEFLAEEKPLRTVELTEEELGMVSGYNLLTLKPQLVVFNLHEGQKAPAFPPKSPNTSYVALQAKLEADIAQLDAEEAALFLEEYNIEEPSLNRMIRLSYDLLGLQSFFTVGEDEVRAWTVKVGATAPEAAGVIHSDLQKGFIRAETINNQVLLECGSMAEARNQGKLRLEGKSYIVQEGDILHIRFNL